MILKQNLLYWMEGLTDESGLAEGPCFVKGAAAKARSRWQQYKVKSENMMNSSAQHKLCCDMQPAPAASKT